MFRYPKNLFENFNNLKHCDLVKNKIYTDETLSQFEKFLNDAQPNLNLGDEVLSRFCKNLYRGKSELFMNLIRNQNSECLVLWTESKQIVRFFQLYRYIYIQYDKDTCLYKVLKHRRLDDPNYKPQEYDNNDNYDNRRYEPRRYDNNRYKQNDYSNNRNTQNVDDYPTLPQSNTYKEPENSFRNKLVKSLLDDVTSNN